MIGKRFGRLVIIAIAPERKGRNTYWLCECDCGNRKVIQGGNLTSGAIKSCGCYQRECGRNKLVDFAGHRFGRLIVLSRATNTKGTPTHRVGRVRWLCLCDCGKETIVQANHLASGLIKSCGCLHREIIKEMNSGEQSNFWKGGISSENKKIKNSGEYREWREKVFERDNYICQYCDKRGGCLHAHHIDGFADNPELRFELNNGATLCKKCHKKYHKLYGILHTNKSDFIEWIEGNK